MKLLLAYQRKLKALRHWPAVLFFSASLGILYFLSSYSYDPYKHKWELTPPVVYSGDEPHYLIIISSILSDGDLSLGNNYQSARLGGTDAGLIHSGHNLDHHSLIQDARTGEVLNWRKVFAQFTPVECDLKDPSCVGFERMSDSFPDYTPTSSQYRELPTHPLPFPALLAMLLRIVGARGDQVEPGSIYIQVFLSWLAGIITYACALKAGLRPAGSLGTASLLYYASPWLVYSRELYPATFLGLLLIAALWAYLSKRYVVSAFFLAAACMQSEAFLLIFPAWVLLLYFGRQRKSAWIFGTAGAISLGITGLISYLLLGRVSSRELSFVFHPGLIWRTFTEMEKGILLFLPWSIPLFCLLILSFVIRNRDGTGVLRVIAAGVFPVAAIYMILSYTGGDSYGPRYWVPYLPWFSLAFVLGMKNFWNIRPFLLRPITIAAVALSSGIAVSAAILSPLTVPFWNKPPWYAARELWQYYHQASPDASWLNDDMQFWLGHDCNQPANDSAMLTVPNPFKSTAVGIVSRLACSSQIPDGTEVVRLQISGGDGSTQVRSLLAGRDTSEWAYDCDAVKPHMKHKRASIFRNYPANFDEPCYGHLYVTIVPLDGARDIRSIHFEWVGGPGTIIIEKLTLIDEVTHNSYPMDPALMPRNH
ncbi:MAG TPA: hypothetical protein VHE60_12845 [Pyrinomonadaceae bacterium]|nr:hypothetical protein [Pyrinomonadaceae bacterium]